MFGSDRHFGSRDIMVVSHVTLWDQMIKVLNDFMIRRPSMYVTPPTNLETLSKGNVTLWVEAHQGELPSYMVFTTDWFLEVAIESWPEWDSNPRPLNSIQTL